MALSAVRRFGLRQFSGGPDRSYPVRVSLRKTHRHKAEPPVSKPGLFRSKGYCDRGAQAVKLAVSSAVNHYARCIHWKAPDCRGPRQCSDKEPHTTELERPRAAEVACSTRISVLGLSCANPHLSLSRSAMSRGRPAATRPLQLGRVNARRRADRRRRLAASV